MLEVGLSTIILKDIFFKKSFCTLFIQHLNI